MAEHFLHTSALCGMEPLEFVRLDCHTRNRLRKLIAQCCEKAFRRGFQQGYESCERGDDVIDLITWRYDMRMDVCYSPHGTYDSTATERMDMECHVGEVGLSCTVVGDLEEEAAIKRTGGKDAT